MSEETGIETMELFMIESLLKGEIVEIPDFGYLEVKSVGEKHTVLFKSTGKSKTEGMNRNKEANALYTFISEPLKEEKIVNLSQIGIFRSVKKENGEIYISFILSPYLRKILNKEEGNENVKKNTKENLPNTKSISKNEPKKMPKTEILTMKVPSVASSQKPESAKATKGEDDRYYNGSSNHRSRPNLEEEGAIHEHTHSHSHERRPSIKLRNVLLFSAIIVAVVFVVVLTIHSNKTKNEDEQQQAEVILSNESISLPSLAEQHYGNPAFWIYIYEANKDKLSSPLNISKSLLGTLIIPDLKTEFDVDVTDSMEIQRANIWAEMVLKEKLNKNEQQ